MNGVGSLETNEDQAASHSSSDTEQKTMPAAGITLFSPARSASLTLVNGGQIVVFFGGLPVNTPTCQHNPV